MREIGVLMHNSMVYYLIFEACIIIFEMKTIFKYLMRITEKRSARNIVGLQLTDISLMHFV